MVMFKNDLDTFCKYLAYRGPNRDHTVYQRLEDRHLEKAVRGLYYVARYTHYPAAGAAITVELDQFCGRVDPDAETGVEERITTAKIAQTDARVTEAVAAVGATFQREALTYTGEIVG